MTTSAYDDRTCMLLARACPRVPLSRPTPIDNTEHFSFDRGEMTEPAKAVLCFDCQKLIKAGSGVQLPRVLRGPNGGIPTLALVHAYHDI